MKKPKQPGDLPSFYLGYIKYLADLFYPAYIPIDNYGIGLKWQSVWQRIQNNRHRTTSKMFSTPQSRAYFNQEVTKGRLISEELCLVSEIEEELRDVSSKITEISMLVESEENSQNWRDKLEQVKEAITNIHCAVTCSNDTFNLEVSLRDEIKQIDHSFFKYVMRMYEERIKELKQDLLKIENSVQQMQKKGFLPYVESPERNFVASAKTRTFEQCVKKLQIEDRLRNSSLGKSFQIKINKMVKEILQKMNKVSAEKGPKDEQRKKQSKKEADEKREQYEEYYVEEMCEMELNLHQYKWINLQYLCKETKSRIEMMNTSNKKIKEGIQNHKKIMEYELREATVRNGELDLTREEAIDFLRDMNDDLKKRLENRNLFLILADDVTLAKSKSMQTLPSHLKEELEGQLHCLKDIGNNLTNSFLDQCSYLISDRFIDDEDNDEADESNAM